MPSNIARNLSLLGNLFLLEHINNMHGPTSNAIYAIKYPHSIRSYINKYFYIDIVNKLPPHMVFPRVSVTL